MMKFYAIEYDREDYDVSSGTWIKNRGYYMSSKSKSVDPTKERDFGKTFFSNGFVRSWHERSTHRNIHQTIMITNDDKVGFICKMFFSFYT